MFDQLDAFTNSFGMLLTVKPLYKLHLVFGYMFLAFDICPWKSLLVLIEEFFTNEGSVF